LDRSDCRELIETGYQSLCLREGSFWNTNGDGGFVDGGGVKNAIVKTLVEEAALIGFAQSIISMRTWHVWPERQRS